MLILLPVHDLKTLAQFLACCSGSVGFYGDAMPVLEMNRSPLGPFRLHSLHLWRLWDHREMIDDEVMNFSLGLLQLEKLHVRRDDRQRALYQHFSQQQAA